MRDEMGDFYFKFYSKEWLVGTALLSAVDKGMWMDLLCAWHVHGKLTDAQIEKMIGKLSPDLEAKFSRDDEGFLYDTFFQEKITEQRKNSKSQKAKADKRWGNNAGSDAEVDAKPYTKPNAESMPLINSNSNSSLFYKKVYEKFGKQYVAGNPNDAEYEKAVYYFLMGKNVEDCLRNLAGFYEQNKDQEERFMPHSIPKLIEKLEAKNWAMKRKNTMGSSINDTSGKTDEEKRAEQMDMKRRQDAEIERIRKKREDEEQN